MGDFIMARIVIGALMLWMNFMLLGAWMEGLSSYLEIKVNVICGINQLIGQNLESENIFNRGYILSKVIQTKGSIGL